MVVEADHRFASVLLRYSFIAFGDACSILNWPCPSFAFELSLDRESHLAYDMHALTRKQ